LLNACILIKVVPTKAEAIFDAVEKIDEVRKVYSTYGRFDIVAFVEVNDYKTLRSVTSLINSIEAVRSTETLAEA